MDKEKILFIAVGRKGNFGYMSQAKSLSEQLVENRLLGLNIKKGEELLLNNSTPKDGDQAEQDKHLIQDIIEGIQRLVIEIEKSNPVNNIEKVVLVSSGAYGLDFFNIIEKIKHGGMPVIQEILSKFKLSITNEQLSLLSRFIDITNNISFEYQYTTDRFYKMVTREFGIEIPNLYITTVNGIEEFQTLFDSCQEEFKPKILKTDMFAVDTNSNMIGSKKFKEKYPEVDKYLQEQILQDGCGVIICFVGGRINGIENTPEGFEKFANYILDESKGRNIIITFAPRAFFEGIESNDINFASVKAFYRTIKSRMEPNQHVTIFTKKKELKNNVCRIYSKTPMNLGVSQDDRNINYKEKEGYARLLIQTGCDGSYQYLLDLARLNQVETLYITPDQTTLPFDFRSIDGNREKIVLVGKEYWPQQTHKSMAICKNAKDKEKLATPIQQLLDNIMRAGEGIENNTNPVMQKK